MGGFCYNTNAGLKMIVNSYTNVYKFGNVYSLGGNYFADIKTVKKNENEEALPYPNPSNNMIHLKYNLPTGTNQAEMYITNISGQVFKTYNIGNAFNDLLLDTKLFAPGEYFYCIRTDNYTSPTSKFIISR